MLSIIIFFIFPSNALQRTCDDRIPFKFTQLDAPDLNENYDIGWENKLSYYNRLIQSYNLSRAQTLNESVALN